MHGAAPRDAALLQVRGAASPQLIPQDVAAPRTRPLSTALLAVHPAQMCAFLAAWGTRRVRARRHDSPDKARVVVREQRHCEGAFPALRAAGAPDEGPAYADGDAAAQVFQVRPTPVRSGRAALQCVRVCYSSSPQGR